MWWTMPCAGGCGVRRTAVKVAVVLVAVVVDVLTAADADDFNNSRRRHRFKESAQMSQMPEILPLPSNGEILR